MLPLVAYATLRLAAEIASERRLAEAVSFDRDAAKANVPYLGMDAETNASKQIQARAALARAMMRYPAPALAGRVRRTFVLRLMWSAQAYVGGIGSRDRKSVLIAVGEGKVNEPWVERCYHHELAHLLRDQASRDFPTKAWRATLPSGWKYPFERGDNDRFLTDPYYRSEVYDAALQGEGFLHPYGTTTMEEDWASYAEGMLSDDPAFRAAVERCPKVRDKARLVAAFYRRIFPGIAVHGVE